MELERLFAMLVDAIRDTDPKRLHHTHRLRDIQYGLVPYRQVRQTLALACSEDYEMLLLRLCAGEGDRFTITDTDVRQAFHQEVAGVNPDLGLLQLHGDVEVHLEASAIAKAMAGSDQAEAAYRPPAAVMEQEEDPRVEATVIPINAQVEGGHELPSPPPIPEPTLLHPLPPAEREAPAGPTFVLSPEEPAQAPIESAEPSSPCAYCGASLPLDRTVNFCPHCGQNLNALRCAQCQAELEYGWRHCITCGHPVPDT